MSFNKFLPFVCVISISFLTGCVSVKHAPLSKAAAESLHRARFTTTQYPAPDFAAMTAGKASFAPVGAAAMVSAGKIIVKENNIPDPAITTSAGLFKELEASRSIKVIPNARSSVQKDDVKSLIDNPKGADYLLDVKTN